MQAVGAKSGAALAIVPRSATDPRMLFTNQPLERNSTEKRTEIIDYFLFARDSPGIRIGLLGIPRLLDEYIGDYALVETTKRILVEILVGEPFVGGNRLQASRLDETRSRTRNCQCTACIRIARKGIHFMSYSLINSVPSPGITSRTLIKLRVCFQWTRGFAEYRRHLPIRLAKPAWDPYSMRVWPVVQKLPAPAAALRWQKVQAHPDQTGLLQTERNAANGTRPRRQANRSHSQQPQAWRQNSG
jgi:hypothetical protein